MSEVKTLTIELLALARKHRLTAPDDVISALRAAIDMNERENDDFCAYHEIWGVE